MQKLKQAVPPLAPCLVLKRPNTLSDGFATYREKQALIDRFNVFIETKYYVDHKYNTSRESNLPLTTREDGTQHPSAKELAQTQREARHRHQLSGASSTCFSSQLSTSRKPSDLDLRDRTPLKGGPKKQRNKSNPPSTENRTGSPRSEAKPLFGIAEQQENKLEQIKEQTSINNKFFKSHLKNYVSHNLQQFLEVSKQQLAQILQRTMKCISKASIVQQTFEPKPITGALKPSQTTTQKKKKQVEKKIDNSSDSSGSSQSQESSRPGHARNLSHPVQSWQKMQPFQTQACQHLPKPQSKQSVDSNLRTESSGQDQPEALRSPRRSSIRDMTVFYRNPVQ